MNTGKQPVTDSFVREHAVPAEDAESYVHLGLDDHYHPTGGYWFPTGETWGDSSGWVSRKSEIPRGELVQFPCNDREPERRGDKAVPDNVHNLVLPEDGDGDA